MPSWIQCPKTHKLIPKEEYAAYENNSAYVQGDIESFKSPIDGEVITTRKQLAEHNRRHGVTDSRDYSRGYIESRARQRHQKTIAQDSAGKRQRVNHIIEAIERHKNG